MIERIETLEPDPTAGGRGWEYLVVTVGPGESLKDARRTMAERVEYGRWELSRSVLYAGGARRYWMRRRRMRVDSTLEVIDA